jgi:hypothetical protein
MLDVLKIVQYLKSLIKSKEYNPHKCREVFFHSKLVETEAAALVPPPYFLNLHLPVYLYSALSLNLGLLC